MRLEGASASVREAYPEAYLDPAVYVTELGGSTFLILFLAVAYWTSRDRERVALVTGYAVVGVGVVLLAKYLLAVPRPPEELHAIAHDDDPYGFPSGHAFMAVVVYGGLALAFDRLGDRRVLLGVGSLIVAISLSRVVLGVHYLGDVLAGALLGGVVLVACHRLVDGEPRRGFALGTAVAVPTVVVTGVGEPYALVALGAGLGGFVGASRLEAIPELRSRVEAAVLSVVGLAFVVGTSALESALAAGSAIGVVALNAVLIAGVLVLPVAVGRVPFGRWAAEGG